MRTKNKLLIFDMDGTLYNFKEGSFKKSSLKKKVLSNALIFIEDKLSIDKPEAKKIFKKIKASYGENISIGLEKEYKLDRYEYFNFVWNIPAKNLVVKNYRIKKILTELSSKNKIILLSDSPKIWIENVLKELGLYDLLKNNIYSGESDFRKIFGNIFNQILQKLNYNPKDCLMIGDQEKTDIIPAKKAGIKTIFLGLKKSKHADLTIKNITEIKKAIDIIWT
ncbi:MAG: HAD family hydrolase [bacterium]